MSAVKNLRAMFEQKGETSPPERGRSPGIPHGPGDSPRPLSKIRTSFIAIEKDGRMGLTREGSQDSISALRKQSGDSNLTTPTTGNERPNPFDALTKSPAKMGLQTQPIPESPRTDTASKAAATPVQTEQAGAKVEPAAGPAESSTANGATKKEETSSEAPVSQADSANGTESKQDASKVAVKETSKPGAKEASKPATRTAKPAPKPLSSLPASKPASKPETSPKTHKGPKTPATTSHPPAAKKTPEKKAQPPEKPATPRTTPGSKPAANKPPSIHASPGFVKPKVKSPTRPVKLPPGLTTHTASSGSKINTPRQSLSRASGTTSTHPTDSHGRPASRASASTAGSSAPHKAATAAPTKGLRRQSSTIYRPRPSLGPPPKQPAKEYPPTKKEKEIDQGFLARMMRPTAASASKTVTGKVQTATSTTPPRKAASSVAKKVAPVGKPVVKKAVGDASSAAQPKKGSTVQQAAVDGKQLAPAAEVVEAAKAAKGEAALPAEGGQETSAEEVAPVVEQSEVAEEEVAAAQEAGDDAALPEAPAVAAVGGEEHQPEIKPEAEEDKAAVVESQEADATEAAAASGAEEKGEAVEEVTVA